MSLYNYISVIGGLAFFLFGMTVLSSGLKKVAGDRLESVLKKMTDNPFSKHLVYIAEHLIKKDNAKTAFLDERLLVSPAIAVTECRKKTMEVLNVSVEGVSKAMAMLESYDKNTKDELRQLETDVDGMVEGCNQFLIRLSSKEISHRESIVVANMLHALGDMERISDYSLNLISVAKKVNKSTIEIRNEIWSLVSPLIIELNHILEKTRLVYEEGDTKKASEIIEETDKLIQKIKKVKKSDLKLLRNGEGYAESSVYISDYLSVLRRITEHSQNIAESLI